MDGERLFDSLTRRLGTELPRRAIVCRAGGLGLAAFVPSLLSVPWATPLAARGRKHKKKGAHACPPGKNFCCVDDGESPIPFCVCWPKSVCPD